MTEPTGAPEFSRVVRTDEVRGREVVREIEAGDAERAALARRLDLDAVESLRAVLRLRRVRGDVVRVDGTLDADVVQSCVVTLEPVRNHVHDSFTALFAPPGKAQELAEAFDQDPLGEEVPELLRDGRIDLGELTAQHLSLALDPYPRRPDADFGGYGEATPEETTRPLAGLARLRRDQ